MKKILLLILLCVASGLHAMRSPTDEEIRHGMVLVDAALSGDSDLIVSLLKNCTDVEFEVFGGIGAALGGAISGGHSDCVKILVEFGADPNEADNHGSVPLYKATCSHNAACIKVLLKMGAYHSPHHTNENGFTPLHVAAKGLWDYFESVEALLVGGANVIALDEFGHSPIKYAVAFTQLKSTELLLQAGANPFKEGLSGESLMGIALSNLQDFEPVGYGDRYEKCRQKQKRQEMIALLEDYQTRWHGMREFCTVNYFRLGDFLDHTFPKELCREIFQWLLRHE